MARDGQGDIFLPDPAGAPVEISAAQFIVEQARAHPGEVTLVPVGPLTNIALALRLEPRIAEWVDEVVVMGGNALTPGNASPAGEANIRNDPEAADLVFGADWQVTMVGLDVTLKVHMTPDDIAEYATHGKPMSDHITRVLPHYRNYFESNYRSQEASTCTIPAPSPTSSIRRSSRPSAGRSAWAHRAWDGARPGPPSAIVSYRPGKTALWSMSVLELMARAWWRWKPSACGTPRDFCAETKR